MKYLLIKGTFHFVRQSPDADSVKFRASNPRLWEQLETDNRTIFERKLAEEGGVITLRFQGIDALETHYAAAPLPLPADVIGKTSTTMTAPRPTEYSQLIDFGRHATNVMIGMIGASAVKWGNFGKTAFVAEARMGSSASAPLVTEKHKDTLPGYIVTGDVELNGRPLAWVFAGETPLADGSAVTNAALAEMLDTSLNYQLLRQGMVYPYYFMSLAGVLRRKLDAAVTQARRDAARVVKTPKPSLWRIDQTMSGVDVSDMKTLVSEKALLPYLFRRVVKLDFRQQMERYWQHLRDQKAATAAALTLDTFYADGNPYVFVVSDQDFLRLGDVLTISGMTLTMKKAPHDIIFLS
ncbi:MAG: hypothetical protein SF123_10845 [Chloroflexota bacterium]|nr:hypothetical protein [Chloroflexota bacterium]